MTAEEKVAAIVAALAGRTVTFTEQGVRIEVSDIGAMPGAPAYILYYARASTGQGANRVWLPVDTDWTITRPYDGSGRGEYILGNPPLSVPDGLLDGEGRKTFVRNDLAAIKTAVYDQIVAYARAHGWAG